MLAKAQLPNLLTLSRLFLAAAAVFARARPMWLLVVVVSAGLTDVLDGWFARRLRRRAQSWRAREELRRAHRTGVWLDPVCDKLFVLTVLLVVWWGYAPHVGVIVLIATREILQVPVAIGYFHVSRGRGRDRQHWAAAWPGKLTTALQFAAILSVMFFAPLQYGLALAAGFSGVVTAGYYLQRLVLPYWSRAAVLYR